MAMVELGPELQQYVDRITKEVLPNTTRELTEVVEELKLHAERHWPVKETMTWLQQFEIEQAMEAGDIRKEPIHPNSRGSKQKWYTSIRMTPDGLVATVGNSAPYSAFTYDKGTGKKPKRTFKRLLFKRFGNKRQKELWAKIAEELG